MKITKTRKKIKKKEQLHLKNGEALRRRMGNFKMNCLIF